MSRAGTPARAQLPAFETVVERHGPRLLRFCTAQVGANDAEDCFQETLIAALRAYSQLRDASALRAWLFTIAANKARDMHRRGATGEIADADVDEVIGGVEDHHYDAALWSMVRALPQKQSQAVALRFVADLSHREIGAVMDISEAAARRNVFEGLKRLSEEIN